jgi:aspartate 1-decarboxylase
MRWFLRSKIHRAVVTDANLDYIGSISIDKELMDKIGLVDNEKVSVWNITNGNRIETYVIPGSSGEITLNGSAAHKFSKGDLVIICGWELTEEKPEAKVILVDNENKFDRYL